MNISLSRVMLRFSTDDVIFGILLFLVFCLPISEAGKNIAALLLLVFKVFSYLVRKSYNYQFYFVDFLLLLFFLMAALSVIFSYPYPNAWRELKDVFMYLSLAWVIIHSIFSKKQIIILLIVLLVSTVFGMLDGLWKWKVTHEKIFFELHSVGFTTQTAIYMAIISCWSLVFSFVLWFKKSFPLALLVSVSAAFSVFVLLIGESRGAVLAFFTGSIFGMFWIYRKFLHTVKARVMTLFALIALITVPFLFNPYIIDKTVSKFQAGGITSISSGRDLIANVSLAAFNEYLWLGVGAGNHGKITEDDVKSWFIISGREYIESDYIYKYHPHNLFLGTMAERGLLGFIALLGLLIFWGWVVFRFSPESDSNQDYWGAWILSISALSVVIVAGLFNTTLHHEHGQLAMLGFGVFFSILKRDGVI
ncbi:O-antigen ligase family protein [Candidatus Thiothrix anitrata]|uniref:O-antigen ligase family protein n=1 Tax=Candidatus Thiothrix anitrata TaxID=2823902 RepID=A0ABX7X6Q6_9GAMM|nr:O-antigen ligase family protein [Candidatus Thiothrix anitrata]QTR48840.1 O-antigen ligase family protein [Candidatus Thiothrix anitrata]